jgi:hypothetical protein
MKLFGNQIQYAMSVLEARNRPANAGGVSSKELENRLKLAAQATRVLLQFIISLIILISCIGLIRQSSNDSITKGCFTLIGTVVGYWLR